MTNRASEVALALPIELALERPLVLMGGKGGVGKTTLATALAIALARAHPCARVRLLSTDPAHSVTDALGDTSVADLGCPNLEIHELDAVSAFVEFRARHKEGVRRIGLRGTFLDDVDLERFLDLSLPGLDELAALKVIAGHLRQGTPADHLIVDTAPTGHTVRLLTLPSLIDGWRAALDSLIAKHRVMSRLYVGRYLPDEADALIAELCDIVKTIRSVLLDRERAVFVPIMAPDPLSLWETQRLLEKLDELGIEVPFVVVNKVTAPGTGCGKCESRVAKEAVWIHRACAHLGRRVKEVAYLPVEPRGATLLQSIGQRLLRGDRLVIDPAPRSSECDRSSDARLGPASLAPVFEAGRIFWVCGKGGVGKTTVACALALWLARQTSSRVLLFSTDPAHSLADALGTPLREEPTPLTDRVDGVEMNPERLLAEFKASYKEEISSFFSALFQTDQVDATLDRKAMESLIDLSPPGLDEIMALSALTQYLRSANYGKLVIDTAPTGHFLRLLELPEVLRSWIRAIFEILLKYKRIFRAPRAQAYLVGLSKSIREIQETLKDARSSVIVPVSIPTMLSVEETGDLLQALKGMGLHATFGVLNHLEIDRSDCDSCMCRRALSLSSIGLYLRLFGDVPLLEFPEQAGPLTGVEQLALLGRSLFGEGRVLVG
ncbi:MAG: ArsA family ATPase [Candidatus Riflebacteria bacterium]|nr:ArsA family ATPase [Candidatus Riflebacteria bacterium]